jgi:hypothetical protein
MPGVLRPEYAITADRSRFIQPFGPIIYKTHVSEDTLGKLDKLAETVKNDEEKSCMSELAGNLANEKRLLELLEDDEYASLKKELLKRVGEMYAVYLDMPSETYMHFSRKMILDSFWVNFQQPFEWNPPHHHSGDYSFVIYLKNDIDMSVEEKHPTQQGNSPTAGKIFFRYAESIPLMSSQVTHFPKRGEMLVFPASLVHQVAPFTEENKERISVAGNVKITELLPTIGDGETII